MCGDEGDIRVETAGNGHVIKTYTPGKRGKHGEHNPGKHTTMVATNGQHLLKLLSKHILGGAGKKSAKSKRGTKRASKQE